MRISGNRAPWWMWALSIGLLLTLAGCDSENLAALEDGVINASGGLLTAFMQAFIGLATEQTTT